MKKNVLFLVDKTGFGGVQTIANKLIKSKIKGVNMYYFFLRDIDYKFGTKKIKKPNVFYSKSKYRYSIGSFFEIKKLIKDKHIDILHMNGDKSTLYGILLKKFYFKNIKLIHHEHSAIFKDNLLYNLMLRKNKNLIDLFIAVSNSTKLKLIENAQISNEKIKLVYNFVDLKKFNRKNVKINVNKEKEKLGIKKEEFVIGFVGRLTKVKGCKYLIQSLPNIKFNYKCLIIGDGSEKAKLEKLAEKLKVRDKVIFLGYIQETQDIYSLLDVFVMPSLSESFGMTLLEAQAKGVPVIASQINSLSEIAGKGVLFVNSQNSSEITKAIKKIVTNKKMKDHLTKKNYNNVKRFSWQETVKQNLKIYNEIKN